MQDQMASEVSGGKDKRASGISITSGLQRRNLDWLVSIT